MPGADKKIILNKFRLLNNNKLLPAETDDDFSLHILCTLMKFKLFDKAKSRKHIYSCCYPFKPVVLETALDFRNFFIKF